MIKQLELITDTSRLEDTCYFEFLPGKYEGECWGQYSAFVAEEVFVIIEGLVRSVISGFDHYAFQEVNVSTVKQLVRILHDEAGKVEQAKSLTELAEILLLQDTALRVNPQDVYDNRSGIARMMRGLGNWLEQTSETYNIVSATEWRYISRATDRFSRAS